MSNRFPDPEDEAFAEIERKSWPINERNNVLEEVALAIEKMSGFGQDTIHSFSIYIRSMKK